MVIISCSNIEPSWDQIWSDSDGAWQPVRVRGLGAPGSWELFWECKFWQLLLWCLDLKGGGQERESTWNLSPLSCSGYLALSQSDKRDWPCSQWGPAPVCDLEECEDPWYFPHRDSELSVLNEELSLHPAVTMASSEHDGGLDTGQAVGANH